MYSDHTARDPEAWCACKPPCTVNVEGTNPNNTTRQGEESRSSDRPAPSATNTQQPSERRRKARRRAGETAERGGRRKRREGRRGGARKGRHEAAKGRGPTAAKRDNKQQHEQEEERKRGTAGPDHDTAQARLLVRTGQGHAISRAVPVRGHGEQVRGAGQAKIDGPKAAEGRSTAPTDRSSRGQGREDQKTPRPSALDSAATAPEHANSLWVPRPKREGRAEQPARHARP